MKVSLNFASANPLDKEIIEHVEAIKAEELKRGRKTSNATAVTMMLSASIRMAAKIGTKEEPAAKGTQLTPANQTFPKKNGVKK